MNRTPIPRKSSVGRPEASNVGDGALLQLLAMSLFFSRIESNFSFTILRSVFGSGTVARSNERDEVVGFKLAQIPKLRDFGGVISREIVIAVQNLRQK